MQSLVTTGTGRLAAVAPADNVPPARLPQDEPRLPELDGLRGLAILMVMVHHFTMQAQADSTLGRLLLNGLYAGWCGVDLFFVLSGFLITGILLEARGSPNYFRRFYIRRVLRIFPLYYGVLLALLVLGPRLRTYSPEAQTVVARQGELWLYATNWVVAWMNQWVYDAGWLKLGHFWSLAVEEHFYFIWPLLVWLLGRRSLIGMCLLCIAGAVLTRYLMLKTGAHSTAVYVLTPCRMDGLATGALAAVLVRGPRGVQAILWPARVIGAVSGLLLLGLFVRYGMRFPEHLRAMQIAGYSLLAWFFAGLLIELFAASGSSEHRLARAFRMRWLVMLGTCSYGLYVFHVMLQPVLDQVVGIERLAKVLPWYGAAVAGHVLLAIGASVLLATVSWRFYERPILRLKRFFPTTGRPATARHGRESVASPASPWPVAVPEPRAGGAE